MDSVQGPHPQGSRDGPGKCRAGADQSQGHSLIATRAGSPGVEGTLKTHSDGFAREVGGQSGEAGVGRL